MYNLSVVNRLQDGGTHLATLLTRDRLRVGWLNGFWEGYRESRRCSRDTYPESYITK